MKKNIFFITLLLAIITIEVFSQNVITREKAYKIIKQKGLVDTLTNNVAGSKQTIPPNTVIKFAIDSMISPSFNSWLFFIDLQPDDDWSHPCKYIFVSEIDGSLVILDKVLPADLPLEYVLKHKRADIPIPALLKKKVTATKKSSMQRISTDLSEKKYAIIINGGGSAPKDNFIRYWNNCSLMYKTLIEKNYSRENIFVLSSDGTSTNVDTNTGADPYDGGSLFSQDLDLDCDGTNDIGYAATKSDVSTVFDLIKDKLEEDYKSNIFIYVTDHGYLPTDGSSSADVRLWLWDGLMSPEGFFKELRKLNKANFIQIVMDECYSGGFADELKKTDIKAVIATSCNYNQQAKSTSSYSYFILEWLSAIKGISLYDNSNISTIVDTDFDGFISFEEASVYAKKRMEFHSKYPQYYSSPFGCGKYIAFDNLQPKAYCNNGKQDNGENGIDCGGGCGNICGAIVINPPVPKCETCDDGVKNQDETGTDCGGVNCQPCGYGGGLNDIVSVSECKYRDDQIVPFGNAPFIFSGSNILTTDNLKLSHGAFTINYKRGDFEHKVPIPLLEGFFPLFYKTETHHIYPSASLCAGSGIYFEESGYQFKPNISYKITFNFRPDKIHDNTVIGSYRYGQLHFSLANDLTNVTVNKQYYPSTENYFFSSDKKDIPFLSSQYYIGNINRVDNQCWDFYSYYSYDEGSGLSFYHSTPNKYNEVSLIFKPDGFYKQLWIYTSNNTLIDFNSLKIEEEYFDYSRGVYIQNTTINENRFIRGKNIYVGNHVTTIQPSGDVLINNGANVIFDCNTVTFDPGFECAFGSTYEVKNH